MRANATNRQTLRLLPARVTPVRSRISSREDEFTAETGRDGTGRDGTRRTRANPTRLGEARARGLHAAIRVCLEFRLERAAPLLPLSSRRTLAQFPHFPPPQPNSHPIRFPFDRRPIYSPRDFESTRSKIRAKSIA